jgi:hypothetical protein
VMCAVSIKPPALTVDWDEVVEFPYGDLWEAGRETAAVEYIVLVS